MFSSIWPVLVLCTAVQGTSRYVVQTSSNGNMRMICRQCGCPDGGRIELWIANQWKVMSNCGSTIDKREFDGTCTAMTGGKARKISTQKDLRAVESQNLAGLPVGMKREYFSRITCAQSSNSDICNCLGAEHKSDEDYCKPKPSPNDYSFDIYLQCTGKYLGPCQQMSNPWATAHTASSSSECDPSKNRRANLNAFAADASRTIAIVIGSWLGLFVIVYAVSIVTKTPLRPASIYGVYSQIFGEKDGPKFLEEDYGKGKVVFFNNILQDGFLFWRCEHPMFAIWPPKGHPYSWWERVIVAIGAWAVSSSGLALAISTWGTTKGDIGVWVVVFVLVSIPTFVFSAIFGWFATCNVCIGKEGCVKSCGDVCSYCVTALGCCFGFVFLLIFVFMAVRTGYFGLILLISVGGLVGDWAILENLKILACFLRHRRNQLKEDAKNDFHLTYQQYENDHCVEVDDVEKQPANNEPVVLVTQGNPPQPTPVIQQQQVQMVSWPTPQQLPVVQVVQPVVPQHYPVQQYPIGQHVVQPYPIVAPHGVPQRVQQPVHQFGFQPPPAVGHQQHGSHPHFNPQQRFY